MKKRDLLKAVVFLILLWVILAMIVQQPILPSPVVVIKSLWQEILKGDILEHLSASLWRVIASTFLAIFAAAPIGLILGQSKKLNDFFAPIIYLLYPIPKVVLVPIVLLFFGIGDLPKIIIIFMILFSFQNFYSS